MAVCKTDDNIWCSLSSWFWNVFVHAYWLACARFSQLLQLVTLFSYLPLRRWEEASRGRKSVGCHSVEEGCCLFVCQDQENGGESPRLTAVPSGGHPANQVAESGDKPEASSRAGLHGRSTSGTRRPRTHIKLSRSHSGQIRWNTSHCVCAASLSISAFAVIINMGESDMLSGDEILPPKRSLFCSLLSLMWKWHAVFISIFHNQNQPFRKISQCTILVLCHWWRSKVPSDQPFTDGLNRT